MSQSIYCNLYQKLDNNFVKVKEFNHLSYFTRDFFDHDSIYRFKDIDFPEIDMENLTKKVSGIEYSFKYKKLHYFELEKIIKHLEKIVPSIKEDYYNKDSAITYEDYKSLLQIVEELKYCLLYSKCELNDKYTEFEFIIE